MLIHPESVVHSLVEYLDGSVLAQLGNPDMRIPISHALGWPERIESGADGLDLLSVGALQFEAADTTRYPCLSLACEALQAGGTAATVLNAANEVAVQAFLEQRIPFPSISAVVEQTLGHVTSRDADTLDVILEDDALARAHAVELIATAKVTVAQ